MPGLLRTVALAVAASFILAPLGAGAQTAQLRGTLTGRVSDQRNAPVPNAQVRAVGAGQIQETATDGSGSFRLSVVPGVYDVFVNKGGFQSNETDGVGVVNDGTTRLSIVLTEATTSTLRVIGRTVTTRQNTLNTGSSASTSMGNATLQERVNPNLAELAPELPGITISRGSGSTPNNNLVVRGSSLETRVLIDGHPVSSGVFGTYNTNYQNSLGFGQIEVLKGAGLNGPNAGESAVGTINLRTRDFTAQNTGDLILGVDSLRGSYYNVFASFNALKDDRLSFLVNKAYSQYLGTGDNYQGPRIGLATNDTPTPGSMGLTGPALLQYVEDFTHRFGLETENFKVRYRFSPSTSVQAGFLGQQGQYLPQGGAYASFNGNRLIAPCYNQTAPGRFGPQLDPTKCDAFSAYNPPYAQGLVGQTIPTYFWFPNSIVQNNEPIFTAELRTSLKNDTILVRPYAATINRFISGEFENLKPGNGGAWYQVTDPTKCQAFSVLPNPVTGAGARGPCFLGNAALPYVGPSPPGNLKFPVTTTPYACSAATPCYMTPTATENDGRIGYGTPFSQPELDRLHGLTFTYLHPVGNNLYNFSYDYNSDYTQKGTNDTGAIPAGCFFVIQKQLKPQPGCSLPFSPGTSIDILPTTSKKNDFSLTGLLQVTPKLQVALGNYLTNWQLAYQYEDPAVFAATGVGSPLVILNGSRTFSHYDPHLGLTYRANSSSALRFTAGSSISIPFAGQISGFPSLDFPNGANNRIGTVFNKNPALNPETTVAYDLGGDFRIADGGILSLDLFNTTIHNVFVASRSPYAGPAINYPNPLPGDTFQTASTLNGPIERNYGIELTLSKQPPIGFGYLLSTTLQRAYLDQLPPELYVNQTSQLINGKQLDGSPARVPYSKAYGEMRWAGPGAFLFTFGADYRGPNNATYGPAFTTFNSTLRVGVGRDYALQLAIDNLFNFNSGTFVGQAVQSGGFSIITYGGAVPSKGVPASFGTFGSSLQTVFPRNARLQLSRRFGR